MSKSPDQQALAKAISRNQQTDEGMLARPFIYDKGHFFVNISLFSHFLQGPSREKHIT